MYTLTSVTSGVKVAGMVLGSFFYTSVIRHPPVFCTYLACGGPPILPLPPGHGWGMSVAVVFLWLRSTWEEPGLGCSEGVWGVGGGGGGTSTYYVYMWIQL